MGDQINPIVADDRGRVIAYFERMAREYPGNLLGGVRRLFAPDPVTAAKAPERGHADKSPLLGQARLQLGQSDVGHVGHAARITPAKTRERRRTALGYGSWPPCQPLP